MNLFTTQWYMSKQPALRPKAVTGASGTAVEREIDLHDEIIAACKARGWKYVHSNPMKPATCGEGVCDFIIYADRGRMFHIECKSRSGKLSLEQQSFIAWVQKLGHRVDVVRNFTEFLEATIHVEQSKPEL